ncbi:MAG: anthranilate synthase component I [Gammaproteobacteria bacterium]|nr:anthranilate synthase component I [Gammaproteobacteria bacterium]HCP49739.1 anthranilate synthase component I [Gammaproteobacteria bacterium]
MNAEEFAAYANEGYNRIPVVHDVIADLETPLSVYLKLANGPFSYLLESAAQGGEKWGRYSIVGLPSNTVLQVSGDQLTVKTDGEVVEQVETDDPLSFIETYQTGFRVPMVDGLPRFYGGLVGYFGYDTVRYVERRLRLSIPPDPLGTPDIVLMVSNELAVYDNVSSRLQLISLVDPTGLSAYDQAIERLHALAHKLESPIPPIPRVEVESPTEEKDFISEFGENNFMQAVERIRDYTRAGDVMQVVLAQRMSVPFKSAPLKLYRALRSLNPSPYMYYMDLDDFHIVSSSPEILARVDNGTIVNRPLAGTRRRGHSDEEDLALEQELLSDPKEIAEHLMLIDLGRNDVGRVAEIGTVEVTEQFAVERYSHVMHISSQVEAKLASGKTAMDVLRATLPVGTLSGAPKIRAMEIIDELEPVKRGIYGGAVGYLAWNGNMDTAIAIRTAVIKDDILYIEAGGGIVADSVPRLEWKESMNKGRAIFQAVRLVESGLQDDD